MPTARLNPLPLLAFLVASLSGQGLHAQPADNEPKKPAWNVNQPPGEPRTVQIDTRTGTWMSVDVSPDGKTLIFDLLGDLYTLPIAGGEAKPLTHSIAWEQQARFSPDGKLIAYLSDAGGGDNVWVMNVDGTAAKAVSHEDYRLLNNPVWHPNGRFIAARKHYTGTRSAGSGEIWLYHVSGDKSGSKGVQLNEKPNWQKDLGEPAISPDGRYLYYSHDATPGTTFEYNKDSNKEIFKIYRQDLHDGSVEPFVQGPGGAVRPTPSPDGRHLAFVRRVRNQSTLFLKNLATGEERAAWGGLERDLQESWSVYGVYPAFAWTPDSRQIVLWAQGKLWRVDPFNGRAADIPFHVKDTREVRPAQRVPQAVAPDRFLVRQLRSVNVSPDGKRVVYSALGQLWLRDLPEGTPRRLARSDDRFEFFPSFSRDGRELVFVAWTDEALGRVVKLDMASGRETVLTPTPGKYVQPRFSPDGKQVVYQKVAGGYLTSPWQALDLGVYLASADGKGTPQRISKEGEDPQFGDRSDAVYLTRASMTSEVDSLRKLVRIDLADRQETEIARSEFASEYAVSPDGQWLGFVERFHAYVVPLATIGKGVTVGPKADMLPMRQLDVNAGHSMHWSGDSRRVHFALGDELFTTALADAFAPGTDKDKDKGKGWRPPEAGLKIGFTQAADKPAGQVALVGAPIVTMKGDEVIADGVVLVDGNRIAAVGPASQVVIPPQAKRIDLRGKTLIPGLIDAHWHGRMGDDEIIPQQSWINHASLAFGVTTVHDPSNRNSEVFTQAELQRAGRVLGPRIYSTGSILYGAKAGITAVVNGLDDALTHLRRQKAEGAISVKSYQQPRRDQRQQLLEAARQTGMMVVPEGGSLFQLNMGMIVDGHTGIEHALPIAEVYDDVKQLWSQTAVGYTPTLNVAYGGLDGEHYWYARTDVWEHPLLTRHVPRTLLESRAVRRPTAPEEDFNVIRVARTATALQRLGVKVNIGAHGQREGLGAHWEMWMLGLGGMTPLEAIRAATLNPAHYLGLDRDLGSIEPGKLADLVVIDGDVLADIRQSDRIHQVMQNGRLYDAATLDEVWPRQKARRPYFFDGAAGVGMPVDAAAGAHTDD
ncbi:MAG: amidohydrolase family protein [Pseudomonadota bacterium]